MTVGELLAQLEAQGIELWTEGGGLRFRAPKGALTPDLRARLTEQREAVIAELRERARQAVKTAPVSQNQLGMWLVHQVAPDNAAYNVSFSARVLSPVDVVALRRTFQALVDRHAALRTTFFIQDGQLYQRVPGYIDVDFQQIDAAGLDDAALEQQISAAYRQPYNLETGPILRARLYTRAPEEHVLLMVIHHIAVDGLSMWVVLNEIGTLYGAYSKGENVSLPYPEAEPSEFARWQTELLAGPQGERLWEYWKEQLQGEIAPLNLPTDRPHPQVMSHRGGAEVFEVSADITQGLKNLAKAEGATLYMVLLAAFQILLHRYTAQDDIIVGTPTLGRSPQFANVVGDFVNVVPMRVHLEGNPTFKECLAQVRQTVLTALQHQEFPFPLMVERLGPRTHMNRSPVFQVTFDIQRNRQNEALSDALSQLFVPSKTVKRTRLGGLEIEAYPLFQQEGQFDLVLQMLDDDTTLPGVLKYSSDIFDGETVARLLGHYEKLLQAIVAHPDQQISELSLLTDAERQQILYDWNATQADYPADTGVHALFEQQVERTPQAIAAVYGEQSLTYAELNAKANQLAHYLRSLGVQPQTAIGVHVERGLDMLVALFGVLKAGAAYVPMDPTFPQERLAYMIEDAAMPIIISHSHLIDELPRHNARLVCIDSDWEQIQPFPAANPSLQTSGNHLAYVIFTSGSTGRPKGVQIEHHSLTNFLLTMRDQPGLSADDVMLALTTLSFDIAGLELYLPLIVGARVVLISREAGWDGRKIAAALDQHRATVMQATPASWQLLLKSGWGGKKDLKMLCGGEALPASLAEGLLELGGELWNMYGPTETTIWSTVEQIVSASETIAIGQPIANTQVFVLDERLQPVPAGVVGTLYIGGDGVARGYIGRDDLTAERFIPNPFGTGRIYNTGDLARWLPDGRLECLGRVDHQVKVRGFRIELGDIEAALEAYPGVQKAVVVASETQPGDKRLVAYVTSRDGAKLESGILRDHLSAKLPNYMVPSAFMTLDAFPMTPNGKVDRRALPRPVITSERAKATVSDAQTPAEALMVSIWQSVLGIDQISVYDNFFDLGGHSLQVVQVIAKLEEATGIHLEPAWMRYQSLRQQAVAIESAPIFANQPKPATPEPGAHTPGRSETTIFFGPQEALYGIYYPAREAGPLGVVICQPWGPEFLRAHRACNQLALRLSNAGIPTLRFDYYGTGDSAGDDFEVSVRRSLDDISTAIAELRQRSGVQQVALVGLRLGATYAALASAQGEFERVVLWEPLVNGGDYLEELRNWHRRNLFYFLSKVTARDSAEAEVLGFGLSSQMISEMQAVNLLTVERRLAEQVLVVERETSETTRRFCDHLQALAATVDYRQIDAPLLWTDNVDKALVPNQTLEAIVDWIRKE